MNFKNTIRLVFSNFTNTWKILLYTLIIILCVLGLTSVAGWHIINTLINNGFFAGVKSSISGLLFNVSFVNIYNAAASILQNLKQILMNNGLLLEAILIFGGFAVVLFYLLGLADLCTTNVISGYMSSCTKFSFVNTYVSSSLKSMAVQFLRTLILFPISIGILFLSLKVYEVLLPISVLLALFTTTLIIIILFSLLVTFFSGWLPAIAVHDDGAFKGLIKGFKALSRRFWRTFSTAIALVTMILAVNLFALSYTYGVGLFITLPLSNLVLIIFGLTMYYSSNGMRYYTDANTIVDTKKLEQQDRISKAKNII